MEDLFTWVQQNIDLIKDIGKLLLSLAAFLYATIIHWKSKKRLTALEARKEVETDLLKVIQDLQQALEQSKGDN